MSEHNLWVSVRNNISHVGHFTRIEYNIVSGVPDVDYCVRGCDGKIELKFRPDAPVRVTTPVFNDGGLRDDQITWIYQRTFHHGRVYILAQVNDEYLLVPGTYCRTFNSLTLHELRKAATWAASGTLKPERWRALVLALMQPSSVIPD